MPSTPISRCATSCARHRFRRVVAGCTLLLATQAGAGEGGSSTRIDFTVTPAAGGVIEQDGLRLSYTLAEPVAGPVSKGHTRLVAGFQALFPVARATPIFDDGFEAASP